MKRRWRFTGDATARRPAAVRTALATVLSVEATISTAR